MIKVCNKQITHDLFYIVLTIIPKYLSACGFTFARYESLWMITSPIWKKAMLFLYISSGLCTLCQSRKYNINTPNYINMNWINIKSKFTAFINNSIFVKPICSQVLYVFLFIHFYLQSVCNFGTLTFIINIGISTCCNIGREAIENLELCEKLVKNCNFCNQIKHNRRNNKTHMCN